MTEGNAYAMGPRREALRHATSAQHAKLDNLVGRSTDPAAYARYLSITTAFRNEIEGRLPRVAPRGGGEFAPLRLLDELLLDCADIELTPALGAAARCPPLALGHEPSASYGALYVLEGSAMGARILMNDARRLGYSGRFAARHLARQLAEPGHWKEFLQLLENADAFDLAAAITGASQVFDVAIACAEACNGER